MADTPPPSYDQVIRSERHKARELQSFEVPRKVNHGFQDDRQHKTIIDILPERQGSPELVITERRAIMKHSIWERHKAGELQSFKVPGKADHGFQDDREQETIINILPERQRSPELVIPERRPTMKHCTPCMYCTPFVCASALVILLVTVGWTVLAIGLNL